LRTGRNRPNEQSCSSCTGSLRYRCNRSNLVSAFSISQYDRVVRRESGPLGRLILIVLLQLPHAALAQTSTATVRGVVVDARDGTPIRRVAVRLQGTVTITGDDGRFEITNAPAGRQELNVSVVDFILVKRTIVVPAEGVLELTIPVTAGTGTYSES